MTETAFLDGRVVLHAGNCLDVLEAMPDASVDAVVTDPPYHFDTIVQRFGKEGAAEAGFGRDGIFRRASAGFMGKQWDGGDIAFDPATWEKVLRVLKPGGMLAAFSAPKCYHKMAFAIEAAGFEMRDRIVHLYDLTDRELAFLESLSAAQVDALAAIIAAGDPLGDLLWSFRQGFPKGHDVSKAIDRHLCADPEGPSPATPEAVQWSGWNVALKPAYEPIALARKPVAERSVAAQVLATGTGGINIDACRIETEDEIRPVVGGRKGVRHGSIYGHSDDYVSNVSPLGRYPANITHDGGDVVVNAFAAADGSAARFFYTAKATAEDRLGSGHPTVKPVALMQWLCRLLAPPGGTILDPFAGTGTTGEAAVREGFSAVLIEREAEYRADIARRMDLAFSGAKRRRAVAHKVRAERDGAAPDPGPLFGTPGVAGGGGQAGESTATFETKTDDRSDRTQAVSEAAG